MEASEATMAKRSGHAVSGCHDGIRERPATGTGSPERRARLRVACDPCHSWLTRSSPTSPPAMA